MIPPLHSKAVCLSIIAIILLTISQTATAAETVPMSKGQTVYAAIYSHIYSGDNERPFNLAATLSIRNTDPDDMITVASVDYYDSDGKLVKKYLEVPFNLKPMSSTRFVVRESDTTGGSGANFLVTWSASRQVNSPLIESVMIGTKLQQGLSFTSRGQVIAEAE